MTVTVEIGQDGGAGLGHGERRQEREPARSVADQDGDLQMK